MRLRARVPFSPCVGSFTAAVWCVPALRVPLVHSLINHFRQKEARGRSKGGHAVYAFKIMIYNTSTTPHTRLKSSARSLWRCAACASFTIARDKRSTALWTHGAQANPSLSIVSRLTAGPNDQSDRTVTIHPGATLPTSAQTERSPQSFYCPS